MTSRIMRVVSAAIHCCFNCLHCIDTVGWVAAQASCCM